MKTQHVSLAFAQLPDAELGDFTQNVSTRMTGNPAFAAPPVTMPALTTANNDYTTALAAAGRMHEAVDQLIESIRRDRAWNDEAARKQLVKLFEVMGPTDPLTVSTRKRLSSLMFT